MKFEATLQITSLIAAYIASVVGLGLTDRWILGAIGPHPAVAETVYWTIVPAAGLGALVAFWFLCSRVEFLWRGYQVGFCQGRAYYQERDASGKRRGLAFDWFPLTKGYRARGLVRLSPRDTWDVDAPVWARGRRDDIAGRITKDLTSYEGWPALLMPDAPAVNSVSGGEAASALIRAMVERWPEWASYVISGVEARRTDGVVLSVPPPEHPTHRLEVTYARDRFEIAYDCGKPGLRAAAQFDLTADDDAAIILCICEFLRELREGEIVVLVRRLDLLTQWRRRDGVRHGADFRSVSRAVGFSRRSTHKWHDESC